MSTALNDQDFPDGVSSEDRLDVFASHYAGAGMARPHAVPDGSPSQAAASSGMANETIDMSFARYARDLHAAAGTAVPGSGHIGYPGGFAFGPGSDRVNRVILPPGTTPFSPDHATPYGVALEEANRLRAELQKRDKEINAQDQELKDRARQILHDAAQVELLDAAVKARDETIKSLHAAKPGMTKDQAKRFAAALEEAQKLRAELQKRDREIARTRDVLGIARWLCHDIAGHLDDEDHETHAEILHHIHTLIGLI